MFDPLWKLTLGFLTGIAFGFLLQKGRAAKYDVIVGQLLFLDWTVVKIMGTAVVVGSIGVHALVAAGWASLHVKPLHLGGIIGGAVLFGVGMAVLGLCPGTTVAALGEGRRDAVAGTLGMVAGASAFVLARPALAGFISAGDLGRLTLHGWAGTSPWPWVGGLVLAWLAATGIARMRRPTAVVTVLLAALGGGLASS